MTPCPALNSAMKGKMKLRYPCMVSAGLGVLSVIAPIFILSLKHYSAPLFPWVRSGWAGFNLLSACLLFCSGVFLGYRFVERPFIIGMSTMAAFPFFIFAEIFVRPTSHNLWPFEFLLYAFIGLIAVAGAFIGKYIRSRRSFLGENKSG
jgi:hypothetical protein